LHHPATSDATAKTFAYSAVQVCSLIIFSYS